MYKNILNILIVITLMMLMGCGGWSYVKSAKSEVVNKKYSFQLPQGWMKLKAKNTVVLTRDSTALQSIKVSYFTKKEAFETIKKEFPTDALPFELAELYLAEYKAANEALNIELVENMPVTIAEKDGFRLHLKTQSGSGVAYQIVITGFAAKDGLYTLAYQAPTIRYFDLDVNNYDTLVKTFAKKS